MKRGQEGWGVDKAPTQPARCETAGLEAFLKAMSLEASWAVASESGQGEMRRISSKEGHKPCDDELMLATRGGIAARMLTSIPASAAIRLYSEMQVAPELLCLVSVMMTLSKEVTVPAHS